MNFKKWVKSIQTKGYNGARMVFLLHLIFWTELRCYEMIQKVEIVFQIR